MTTVNVEARTQQGAGSPASRTVDWYPVFQFAQALVQHPDTLPVIGTLAWQHMSDDDKALACIAAAPHYALQLDIRQAALAQASKDVATAADWTAVARGVQRRASGVYIPREVA